MKQMKIKQIKEILHEYNWQINRRQGYISTTVTSVRPHVNRFLELATLMGSIAPISPAAVWVTTEGLPAAFRVHYKTLQVAELSKKDLEDLFEELGVIDCE
jgi:hypothetical protein